MEIEEEPQQSLPDNGKKGSKKKTKKSTKDTKKSTNA